MQRLYEVAEKEGLLIEEQAPLPEGFYGLYYNDDHCHPIASLSREIYGQRKLERIVLAEEIGHHLTTTTHCLPKMFQNYQHRLHISREEYRASRHGSAILITANELLGALAQGIDEIWDLAEHFNVPDDYMKFRLKIWEASGR